MDLMEDHIVSILCITSNFFTLTPISVRAHNFHLCDSHGFLCVLSYVRKIVGGYGQSYYYHIMGDQMIITPNMHVSAAHDK